MKIKKIVFLSMLFLVPSIIFAKEAIEEQNSSRAHIQAKHHEEGNFYAVVKGLVSLGDKYTEEAHGAEPEAILKGDTGKGFGIDLGYRLGYGFATELDFAYTHTTVTKSVVGEPDKKAGADYFSYGIDLIYGYHLSEKYVLFGKIGWEIEKEKISGFDIKGTKDGYTYAAGMEHGLNEHWAIIAEYEGSAIAGPKGDNIFAGVLYTF